MKDVLGLVMAFDAPDEMRALGDFRTAAATPFGGRYRAVDFMLSNMVNAGMTEVGLVLRNKYQSLLNHIGTGADWDLDRKLGGLTILPPFSFARRDGTGDNRVLQGRMDALIGVTDYILRSNKQYVIIADGDVIANMDMVSMMREHKETGADISVVCLPEVRENGRSTYYAIDENNAIRDYNLGIRVNEECRYTAASVLLMSREMLLYMITQAVTHNKLHLERDMIPFFLGRSALKVQLFRGFFAKLQDVKGYYDANMALLDKEVRNELFYSLRPVYTRVQNEEPTYYSRQANAKGSLIAGGCTIEGTVEQSILFRNVKIYKGAVVKHSIVMKDTEIYPRCDLSYVIADKKVLVKDGRTIIGQPNYPVVIAKRSVI